MKKTIVFIHGMFQNAKSWQHWTAYFNARGYRCVAPSWPDHEGEPAALRAAPPPSLGDLSLEDVLAAMEKEVLGAGGDAPDPADRPILIGHSVGGLVVQRFVNNNLASCAVAIAPVAPNMIMTLDWPFFKNVASIANPLAGSAPFEQTPESFHAEFCNTLSEAEAQNAFEETATHDSRTVLRGCLGVAGQVDLDLPHVPMLFIGGAEDRIIPAELVEKNSRAYNDSTGGANTYREFKGRSHFICGEPGWEEVAETVYKWLEAQAGGQQPAS